MGILNYFYPATTASPESVIVVEEEPRAERDSTDSNESSSSEGPPSPSPARAAPALKQILPLAVTSTPNLTEIASSRKRRFSFRPFATGHSHDEPKHNLTAIHEHEKKVRASTALSQRLAKPLTSTSDKKAKESAMILRSLILGRGTSDSPKVTAALAKPQLSKIKTQLMQPKSANRVIAQLRVLPTQEVAFPKETVISPSSGVIHAVCLSNTDLEADELHFCKLGNSQTTEGIAPSSFSSFSSLPVDSLVAMFNEMHLISLVTTPDLGLGQPGDGQGLLAGAVPTAETVINGIEQITPQLLALGFAAGKAVLPDHTGVYPPTDRMSVLTYWWGLEIVLPPPSLDYLSRANSISDAVMNFLSALALVNNGVREILPFIRYISQFIDFEFTAIKAQNRGQGVVCAATWIMPAAMVPRPWDFPSPPNEKTEKSPKKKSDPNETPSPIVPFPITHPSLPSMGVSEPDAVVPGPATPNRDGVSVTVPVLSAPVTISPTIYAVKS
ncbi:hypothetical protein C8J56DRAFT_926086 [Mycena floridula]|nr:hypothetical protein C8J56DRAFT_926086 [Mycena floridula]